ncbi:MAG TPA: hypothetical protein VMH92_08295 [Acidocella sp.]|nr:hypothetical protein [Acidocella sp.]
MHRLARLALPLAVLLPLAACNANGARAQNDFNAAGSNLGNGKIASGATDIGRGFSDGANATGDAITGTAHKIGQAFQQ